MARILVVDDESLIRVLVADVGESLGHEVLTAASIKEGQYGTEVKLHDKVKALELLGKHLGVFDSGNGPGNEQENNIFEVIDQSTREEIDTDEIPEIEPPAKSGHDLVE